MNKFLIKNPIITEKATQLSAMRKYVFLVADGATKPEIVLQAGITSPQSQICFSRDGRLLASMGINGNAIKLWEVASGRLLRQFETSIAS